MTLHYTRVSESEVHIQSQFKYDELFHINFTRVSVAICIHVTLSCTNLVAKAKSISAFPGADL